MFKSRSYHASELRVRLGEYDVNSDSEPLRHTETDVAAVYTHPDYTTGTLLNDIALVSMAAAVDFASK